MCSSESSENQLKLEIIKTVEEVTGIMSTRPHPHFQRTPVQNLYFCPRADWHLQLCMHTYGEQPINHQQWISTQHWKYYKLLL